MLNTDAHNPMVVTKMTKADFVRINTSTGAEEHAPKVCLDRFLELTLVADSEETPPSIVFWCQFLKISGRLLVWAEI